MDHDDGLARAFVEVMQADAVAVEEVADKGIMFAAEVHREMRNAECGMRNEPRGC